MNKTNTAELFRRIVEAIENDKLIEERVARLEAKRQEKIENARPIEHREAPDRPVHSGHKGGAFMSEARTGFADRFSGTGLEWKLVNKWISQLFKIGSQAGEGATEEDLTWLFDTLATSLENGFAQAMQDMAA